jgi:hypothetical protein
MRISNVLRNTTGPGLTFYCPGCKSAHHIYYRKVKQETETIEGEDGPRQIVREIEVIEDGADGTHDGPTWTWDGDVDKPTFNPSILIRSGHYAHTEPVEQCWCTYNRDHPNDHGFTCYICHSFIREGKIQFLGDCTHALAGQTVDMVPFPDKDPG